MKRLLPILLILTSCVSKQVTSCDHGKDYFVCVKYLRNYDGDTITVNIPNTHPLLGEKISIRVNGVDTPELRTKNPCEKAKGFKAKELVQSIMQNAKNIELRNVSRGKYFRIVADVIADGVDIKKALIDARLAVPYDGGKKTVVDWCEGVG